MPRQRTWTDEQFTQAVAESISVRQVLIKLNLCATGSAYQTVRNNVERLQLSTEHFKGRGWAKGRAGTGYHAYQPASYYLKLDGPTIQSSRLRQKLLKEGLVQEVCSECGLGPEWNGKAITLQLDHVNGNKHDNRFENLRLLCPNCHSQQETSSSVARYDHT